MTESNARPVAVTLGPNTRRVLVSNQSSPDTSSRHRACSCCVIVSTDDCIYAFHSTIAWLLKYHLSNILATGVQALFAWW
jgi:hypothetical protein